MDVGLAVGAAVDGAEGLGAVVADSEGVGVGAGDFVLDGVGDGVGDVLERYDVHGLPCHELTWCFVGCGVGRRCVACGFGAGGVVVRAAGVAVNPNPMTPVRAPAAALVPASTSVVRRCRPP